MMIFVRFLGSKCSHRTISYIYIKMDFMEMGFYIYIYSIIYLNYIANGKIGNYYTVIIELTNNLVGFFTHVFCLH